MYNIFILELLHTLSLMEKKNLIGQRIRLARTKANPRITQNDLAARLQIEGLQLDQAAISRIESGTHELTDIEIATIAKVLDVAVGWLFNETTDK